MKKVVITMIVLVLLLVNFGVALAAPWGNPNGYLLEGVTCEGSTEMINVWVHSPNSSASFDPSGQVGITKAIYFYNGTDYEFVWGVGKGVYKNTTRCYWELEDGSKWAGDILVP